MTHELERRWPTPEENPYLEMQVATEAEVNQAILITGLQIAQEYKDKDPLFVVVQNGGNIFAEKLKPILTQCWGYEPEFASIKVSRTDEQNNFSDPHLIEALSEEIYIEGRPVVVVEDMIDEGKSLNMIDNHLVKERRATDVKYTVAFERLSVDRPAGQIHPEFVAIKIDTTLWLLGNGPDDRRILQPDQDINTTLPLDGGRSWPGLWLNRPN